MITGNRDVCTECQRPTSGPEQAWVNRMFLSRTLGRQKRSWTCPECYVRLGGSEFCPHGHIAPLSTVDHETNTSGSAQQ
jgi:hypothetical protein